MRRKIVAILLVSLLAPVVGSAQTDWVIEHFDAALAILPDGSMRVDEKIAVDFKSLEKHGIYRDIPVTYQDTVGVLTYTRISDIAVLQDGTPAKIDVARTKANVRIRIGDPDNVISGKHDYAISYTVRGVLRSFGEYDELYWNVTGNEWEVPINAVAATVTVPATVKQLACYAGSYGATNACAVAEAQGGVARFSDSSLSLGEGLTVAVGFTAGVVPIVEVAAPLTARDVMFDVRAIAVALAVIVGGVFWILRRWWRYGRDRYWQRAHLPGVRSDRDGASLPEKILPLWHRQPVSVEYDPPDDLRPAEMGVLLDERADTRDVSATIIDLAVRGYLQVSEIPRRWSLGSNDYELERTDTVAGHMLLYEQELLKRLFEHGKKVKISELKNKFYDDLRQVKTLLYQNMKDKQLFADRPDTARLRTVGRGIVIVVIGAELLFFIVRAFDAVAVVRWYHFALTGLAQGLTVVGIATFLMSHLMPRKTGYGRELYERVRGYQVFVSGTEKYRAKFYENEGLFVQVLPYAIMFGVTDRLAKAFASMGLTPPQPSWWHGVGAFNASEFSASVTHFQTALSSAMASTPSGSGSGGGGSSGGGFGGGGGGSW